MHPLVPVLRLVFACLLVAVAIWLQVSWVIALTAFLIWLPLGLIYPVLSSGSPCTHCNSGTQSTTTVQSVVTGVVNGTCSSCSVLNATYIMTYTGASDFCVYNLNVFKTPCVFPANFGHVFVWRNPVNYSISSLPTVIEWRQSNGETYDCQDVTNVFGSATPFSTAGTDCDFSAATAVVTTAAP